MLLLFERSFFFLFQKNFREIWNQLWSSFSGSHAVRLSVCVGQLPHLQSALLPQHPDSKLQTEHAIITIKNITLWEM